MEEASKRTETGTWKDVSGVATGICYYRSEVRLSDVTDGAASTYLVGEKFMVTQGHDSGDDCPMYGGFDDDRVRWTHYPVGSPASEFAPSQDHKNPLPGYFNSFGSAHSSGFNMSMCDGSVRHISYDIDLETHRRLGNRKDGLETDTSKF